MSIPLEAPSVQFDPACEPGEVIADAAQRDLFEFFSAPLPEEAAPALAADPAPAAGPAEPVASVATIGEYLAEHEEVRQDGLSHGDVSQYRPAKRGAGDAIA